MPDHKDHVFLLHGLARTKNVMTKMAEALTHAGYEVTNIDYPSRQLSIEALTDMIAEEMAAARPDTSQKMHIVAHSLGSILAHFYIKKYQPENLGYVVALGPPYRGSGIIDRLRKYRLYHHYHGPAALRLGTTTKEGIYSQLGDVDYKLGIIAGNKVFISDWFFAKYWLDNPSDGKVSVTSTQIPGYQDHIILPVNHVFLPQYPEVIDQTLYFLKHGRFSHPAGGKS